MCNTNAIEIITKSRIWPRALNYSNFFLRAEGKKSKTFYSKQKTFKQETKLGKDAVSKWISLREIQRTKASFREQELKEKSL